MKRKNMSIEEKVIEKTIKTKKLKPGPEHKKIKKGVSPKISAKVLKAIKEFEENDHSQNCICLECTADL